MASNARPGLFSRVADLVRSPSQRRTVVEESAAQERLDQKQIRALVERKRRNDAARKAEFDMLRKLRRREILSILDADEHPSGFQNSQPSRPDDRAGTIKKIDEIEAQMSMQWWKDKSPRPAHAPDGGAGGSAQVPLQSKPALPPSEQPTEPAHADMALDFSEVLGPARAPARDPLSNTGSFAASQIGLEAAQAFEHEPDLEEAAIRFANGDNEGAEVAILELLSRDALSGMREEIWLTLLDLYRATGDHARFERAAIDFADCFGRSAPAWFSMVERVATDTPAPTAATEAAGTDIPVPALLGLSGLRDLQARLVRSTQPWRLDWSALEGFEADAGSALLALFSHWCTTALQLRFAGIDRLDKALRKATPSGESETDPAWWRLRMEALRLMHRPDEFELVALDYCVTYEVSPPSWELALCQYKPLDEQGQVVPGHTLFGEALLDSEPFAQISQIGLLDDDPDHVSSYQSTLALQVAKVRLQGEVLGEATDALQRLDAAMVAGWQRVLVDCQDLIRVDFSATGSLLNWVTARQAEGYQIRFAGLQRLVAIFFCVIGINESARITIRID